MVATLCVSIVTSYLAFSATHKDSLSLNQRKQRGQHGIYCLFAFICFMIIEVVLDFFIILFEEPGEIAGYFIYLIFERSISIGINIYFLYILWSYVKGLDVIPEAVLGAVAEVQAITIDNRTRTQRTTRNYSHV